MTSSLSPNLVVRQHSDSGGGVPNDEIHAEEVSAFAIDDDDTEKTLKSTGIEKKPEISK